MPDDTNRNKSKQRNLEQNIDEDEPVYNNSGLQYLEVLLRLRAQTNIKGSISSEEVGENVPAFL